MSRRASGRALAPERSGPARPASHGTQGPPTAETPAAAPAAVPVEGAAGPGGLDVPRTGAVADRLPAELRPDCGSCFGLCCVALPFAASNDFPVDKPGGTPCSNLRADFGCSVHDTLRDRGYRGCVVFDCHGAGQKVSQVTFGGTDWRAAPGTAREMFAVLPVMRQLHELLTYVTEALALPAARPVHGQLAKAADQLRELTLRPAPDLLAADLPALRQDVNRWLARAGELHRATAPGRRPEHRGADLTGARLAGRDLRGAGLRGARLLAADLRAADLRQADLTGADLRDANLAGADLREVCFLTGSQLAAARGDAATRLPEGFQRPAHWPDQADGGGRRSPAPASAPGRGRRQGRSRRRSTD